MASQPDGTHSNGRSTENVADTRRYLSERLSDPYLTDHDRWVLRQLGRFLSGIAPEATLTPCVSATDSARTRPAPTPNAAEPRSGVEAR